jgi:acylphosphatase
VEREARRTVEITVHGDVQGVGFRWFARRAALELGVDGAVQNRSDGSVRIVAHGSAQVLQELTARVRQGPPHSTVLRVDVRPLAESFSGSGFSIVH